jgi:hypothetical protein
MQKQPPKRPAQRERKDGRKSFLVYLPAKVITDLKVAALHEGKHAYQLTEEAVRRYLVERRTGRKVGS